MRRLTAAVAIYLIGWTGAGTALAVPAEMPPADFIADQYIDSQGCVFVRQDDYWVARIDRDGGAICGYPPSVTSHRPSLPVDPETARQQASKALAEALATGLQNGELRGDLTAALERSPAPVPRGVGPAVEIARMVDAAPALREAMAAGARPNNRLCELLGGDARRGGTARLGADPTRGMCSGLPDSNVTMRIIAGDAVPRSAAPSAQDMPSDQASLALAPPPGSLGQAVTGNSATDRDQGKPVAPPTGATAAAGAKAPSSRPALSVAAARASDAGPASGDAIPASARYVQLGWFTDDLSANAVIRQVAAMGLPVARGRKIDPRAGRLVLAGPFKDRRDLVIALRRLRISGFAGAMPR